MDSLTYEQRLQKLNLPSLEYRRLRGDLIEVFKITHNIYDPISTKDLLTFSCKNTTRLDSNPYRLKKPHVNKKSSQMFFTNRIIDTWNNLPLKAVSAKSLNIFKNEIDFHLRNYMFSTKFSFNVYIHHNESTKLFN